MTAARDEVARSDVDVAVRREAAQHAKPVEAGVADLRGLVDGGAEGIRDIEAEVLEHARGGVLRERRGRTADGRDREALREGGDQVGPDLLGSDGAEAAVQQLDDGR